MKVGDLVRYERLEHQYANPETFYGIILSVDDTHRQIVYEVLSDKKIKRMGSFNLSIVAE